MWVTANLNKDILLLDYTANDHPNVMDIDKHFKGYIFYIAKTK